MKHSLGIHISEKAVRLVVIDARGNPSARAEIELFNEDPELIWQSVLSAVRDILSSFGNTNDVSVCGVTSPPGWFVAVDSSGHALCTLPRGAEDGLKEEVGFIKEHADSLTAKTGARFDSSSAISKILHLKRTQPELFRKTRRFIPVSGFITGKLSGTYFSATASFGPEMGFDCVSFRWHKLVKSLGILTESLPKIVPNGEAAGRVSSPEAVAAGLAPEVIVTAPASDELCLVISSGATSPGSWNSFMGNDLVITSIEKNVLNDPLSRIKYSCMATDSWTASAKICAGELSLPEEFRGDGMEPLLSGCRENSLIVCPPPNQTGGMLPFLPGEDEGFIIGKPEDDAALFSGYVEGIAFMERWSFEILEKMGLEQADTVFATGNTNDGLLRIRADITGKKYMKPAEPTPEFGMAVLGLSGSAYGGIAEAAAETVKFSGSFEPDQSGRYRGKYRKLRSACRAIGYE